MAKDIKTMADFRCQPKYYANADLEKQKKILYIEKNGKKEKFMHYDKIWCGKVAEKVNCLADLIKSGAINSQSIVYILIQGAKVNYTLQKDKSGADTDLIKDYNIDYNYTLVWDKDKNIIYKNKHIKSNGLLHLDCLQKETGAKVVEADLPFLIYTKTTKGATQKPKDLESALQIANLNDIDL